MNNSVAQKTNYIIEIRDRNGRKTLFEGEFDNLKEAIVAAIADHVDLNNVYLYKADLSGMNLSYISLKDAYMHKVNLKDASLKMTDLSYANLSCSDLTGANLQEAVLVKTNLKMSNLNRADLSNANLNGAFLYGADLDGAILDGVDFAGANIHNVYLQNSRGYRDSHEIFSELIRRRLVSEFTMNQWGMIGIIINHNLCWDSIKNRFGEKMLPIFEVLANESFDEYLIWYEKLLKGGTEWYNE